MNTENQTQGLNEIFSDLADYQVNELSDLCISKDYFSSR